MKINYLLLSILLLIFTNSKAQDYKSEVINSDFSKETLMDNAMNWLLGYTRSTKIKKLKSESTSGKSTVDEENYIVWENNETQNILVSNSLRFKAYDIKYNVHIKIKNNKTMIIVKNVFWRNYGLSEKVPYTSISKSQNEDYPLAVVHPSHYKKMIPFFDDYIQTEFIIP